MDLVEELEILEDKLSLFELRVDGIPIWERIRFDIYREARELLGKGKAHTEIDFDVNDHFNAAGLFIRNIFHKNPFLSQKGEIIFFGHGRRKMEKDGYWKDIYCDPIHEALSMNSVHLEKDYLLSHKTPTNTEQIRYIDLIVYGGTIQRKLGIYRNVLTEDDIDMLNKIESKINRFLDLDVTFTQRVRRMLTNRRCRKWMYEILVDKIQPSLAIVVVSYGPEKETFIEVCKSREIPVVELQHGTIHDKHMGYSYPLNKDKNTFPDYLLTWGKHWGENTELPISDDRIIPVGFPYLERSVKEYKDADTERQIIFISQGTIGEQLSKFAVHVSEHSGIDYDIIYKLHPGEYDRWQEEYPWLMNANLEIFGESAPPLYQLFAKSSVQVGVNSTALYEGLCFDLDTYLYNCQETEVPKPLVYKGGAKSVSTADQLAQSLRQETSTPNPDPFFTQGAYSNVCEHIETLL